MTCEDYEPEGVTMATEVVHGPAPQFHAPANMREAFTVTITGHYTETPDLAAAGVTDNRWQSDRPVKQTAELLVLRTAFLDWFLREWKERGGSAQDAYSQVWGIINQWR